RQYSVQWGLYRVSSLNRGTLRILESILAPGDRAALERYIHSGGRDNEFFFIEGGAFLRYPDGTVTQIYPETKNNQDRPLRKRVIIYCDRKTYSQVLSSTPGIGLYPVFINKMNRLVQYRWRTDYGMFLSWSAATYQVKQLGRETITAGETKIYWSLPLSQRSMGLNKNRARIELNVMDQRTGKIIGEGVIFVICKEGRATIEE
ncbi:MAG TPA: hypothetical protein VHY08_25675, partial [Bacillota bacterium]|nr:hypothetical protein [Bacillota bacterium]